MSNTRQQSKRGVKKSPGTKKRIKQVSEYLNKMNYDPEVRLPPGFIPLMMMDLNINRILHAKEALKYVREADCGGVVSNRIFGKSTNIQDFLRDNKLFRDSKWETVACDVIRRIIHNLPQGGAGMFIGTPTPLCVYRNESHNKIIFDNFEVASSLRLMTSCPITIFIGNAVDRNKANLKALLWISAMELGTKIKTLKVDRRSFHRLVENFARNNKVAKIVLMGSGHWNDVKGNDYNLDLNFEAPSIELTSKYKNLHILAMCRKANSHGFIVRYLNNGKSMVFETMTTSSKQNRR